MSDATRFDFGKNWSAFLEGLTAAQIERAKQSLRDKLGDVALSGKSFLDVGSGSGLLSLSARQLGAKVHSFDFDAGCVACAQSLKRRFCPDDPDWRIEQGSILDDAYVSRLGEHDIVYSWGVLHHTGDMAGAFERVAALVAEGGVLYIAIYNDQGRASRYWRVVKRLYNRNAFFRFLVLASHSPLILRWYLLRRAAGSLEIERGMAFWPDIKDWFGGYPFEVATHQQVVDHFRLRGFNLVRSTDVGHGSGCNEFVFRKDTKTSALIR